MKIVPARVFAGSGENSFSWQRDGSLHIKLRAQPRKGQANRELVKFLSKKLRAKIVIRSGLASKNKILEVSERKS